MPPGIILPAVVIAAGLLLAYTQINRDAIGSGRRLEWGVEFRAPMVLTLVTGVLSLVNTPERTLGVFALVYLCQQYLIFFTVINVIRSREDVRFIVTLMLLTLVVQSCIYFLQSSLGLIFTLTGEVIEQTGFFPRVGGTVSVNSLAFGKFITPMLLIGVASLVADAPVKRRGYVAVAVTMGMAVVVMTFARSVWGGVALGIVAMLIVGVRRRLIRPGMVALVGAAGVAILLGYSPWIVERLSADIGADYQERKDLMTMAVNIIKAHPIFGSGLGSYPYVVRAYITPDVQHSWLYAVHNVYLLRAAETGIPGGLAFVWLLWRGARLSLSEVSRRHREYLPVTLGLFASMVALAFEVYWDANLCIPNDMMFAFILGLLVSVQHLIRAEDQAASAGASAET